MSIMVTGGFGFIGSNFVRRYAMLYPYEDILVLDKFTYAANLRNLEDILGIDKSHIRYAEVDIADAEAVRAHLSRWQPHTIFHFAAESHVDNSIRDATAFLHSNVYGTVNLLEQVKRVCPNVLFMHISTDEVFGSLKHDDPQFTENTPYAPRSPYAASKAASDHFVRAYNATHKLRTIITNCSNNYGPYQHPEKFIPTVIRKALAGEKIPVYGNGQNMRDWLHVEDHCDALIQVSEFGIMGEQYCIGGGTQRSNIHLAMEILGYLGLGHELIEFVKDRKGHDFRYDIDSDKVYLHTGWKPLTRFDRGLKKTVDWYVNNMEWVKSCAHSESFSQAESLRASTLRHSQQRSKSCLSMTSP